MDHTGNVSQTHYRNKYLYNTGNKLDKISDDNSGVDQYFVYNVAGNIIYHRNDHVPFARDFCWDEQNRLLGMVDRIHGAIYQYDANGERTCKITGHGNLQNINGAWQYTYMLDNPTLYASPYLVATQQGYTKHYYAESERVASRIGGGGLQDLCRPSLLTEPYNKKQAECDKDCDDVLGNCLHVGIFTVKPRMYRLRLP